MLACIIGLFVIKRHVSSISAIFMTRTSQILVINPVHKVNIYIIDYIVIVKTSLSVVLYGRIGIPYIISPLNLQSY
jgi:hypothetical protein